MDEIGLDFAQLTGPKAPHGFRIVLRQQLKPEDIAEARQTSFANAPPPHPGDLVLALHQFMSDARPYQVCTLVPANEMESARASVSLQPVGNHPRRHISWADRQKTVQKATAAFESGAISQEAHSYLKNWAQETLRRHFRPPEYSFLRHRFDASDARSRAAMQRNPHAHGEPRPIVIWKSDGSAELDRRVAGEEDEDQDEDVCALVMD